MPYNDYMFTSSSPVYKDAEKAVFDEYKALSLALIRSQNDYRKSHNPDAYNAQHTLYFRLLDSEFLPAIENKRLKMDISERDKFAQDIADFPKLLVAAGIENTYEIRKDLDKLNTSVKNISTAPDRITDQAIEDDKTRMLKVVRQYPVERDEEVETALRALNNSHLESLRKLTAVASALSVPGKSDNKVYLG